MKINLKIIIQLSIFTTLLIFKNSIVRAQSDTIEVGKGELAGKVVFQNAFLPYARVGAYRNNQLIRKTHADSSGVFSFHKLPGGWYKLKAITKYDDILISNPVFVKNTDDDFVVCDEFKLFARKVTKLEKKYPDTALKANIDSIMVLKSKREMYIFNHHKLLKVYHVCLGNNPIGAKQFEGDGKTPEGLYKIVDKYPFGQNHKYLSISYPSPKDIEFAKKGR